MTMQPTPIILVTGFLGSGKTTFINQLVHDHPGKKISLILNEFGDIKLESQFIEAKGIGMISELSGGCLCCVASVDLPRVIRYTLEKAPATEYLIIEASGLSDPDPVRATLKSNGLSDLIRLDTVVAIVDVDNFAQNAVEHPLVMSQIAEADLAIISKSALHSESQLSALITRVSSIGMGTRTLVWDDTLNTDIIFDPPLDKSSKVENVHHHTHVEYEEFWYTTQDSLDPNKLFAELRQLNPSILRVKGYTHYQSKRYLIQKVGNHVDVRYDDQSHELTQSAILVIGQHLDHKQLNTLFTSCLTKE